MQDATVGRVRRSATVAAETYALVSLGAFLVVGAALVVGWLTENGGLSVTLDGVLWYVALALLFGSYLGLVVGGPVALLAGGASYMITRHRDRVSAN